MPSTDLQRPLRGAFPGPALEPDATVRAQLAQLGQTAVRYGAAGLATTPSNAVTTNSSTVVLRNDGTTVVKGS